MFECLSGKQKAQHPEGRLLSLPKTVSESLYNRFKGYNVAPWKLCQGPSLARQMVIFYPSNIDFFSSIKYKCLPRTTA
jgi:hypothetical protein